MSSSCLAGRVSVLSWQTRFFAVSFKSSVVQDLEKLRMRSLVPLETETLG